MERKTFGDGGELKTGVQGLATATFIRYNVVDHDGDVTLPGAVPEGAIVPVSPWNHGIWKPGGLPVGKATLSSLGDEALAEVKFFLNMPEGLAHWQVLDELKTCEWSYGYDVLDFELGDWQGQRVRFLKSLAVYEVSPVLRGAGIGTGTANLRSLALAEWGRYVCRTRGLPAPEDLAARDLALREQMRFIARQRVGS
jgi:hypothetical protein